MRPRPIWTEDTDERLTELWNEQAMPSQAIANILGCSKGAVIGRANRLGLRRRLNPNIGGAGAVSKATRQVVAVAVAAPPPIPIPSSEPPAIGMQDCAWPEGEPRTPGFHYCGEPALPGHSYCLPHCKRAFTYFGRRPSEHPGDPNASQTQADRPQ